MTDMSVANTILAQLGGRRFLTMTGANSLAGSSNSLSMRLPRNPKKVSGVIVELNGNDTYTLKALAKKGSLARGTFKIVEISNVSGLYCDQLCEAFEEVTGLYTSL